MTKQFIASVAIVCAMCGFAIFTDGSQWLMFFGYFMGLAVGILFGSSINDKTE